MTYADANIHAQTLKYLPFQKFAYITSLQGISHLIPDWNIHAACFVCHFHCTYIMAIFRAVWFAWNHKAML